MRNMLIAAAAGLLALSAVPAAASSSSAPQARPYMQDRNDRDRHDDRRGPDRGDQYGRWDNGWGARPNGPPSGWGRNNDWYRHVRACQVRYRSYNPRTDTFVVRRGVMSRCRL